MFDRGTTAPGPEGDKLRLDTFPFLGSGGEKNSVKNNRNLLVSQSQNLLFLREGTDSLYGGHIGGIYTGRRKEGRDGGGKRGEQGEE